MRITVTVQKAITVQNFIVVASLVSELAGGQNDAPPPSQVFNVTKNTLVL